MKNKIIIFTFISIIFAATAKPAVGFSPFGLINDRIKRAKTFTTSPKSIPEKIVDKIITFPGDVVSGVKNILPKSKPSSLEVQNEKVYFEMKKQKATPLYKYAGDPDLEESNVQGAAIKKGEVLQAVNTSYIQYLPIPGKANFASNEFNGGASINYPIKLPPGPGGYGPKVSVNYSSSAVDELMHGVDTTRMHFFARQSGPLGLGWSINGGEGSISIDTHGKENPCYWTYKIIFPGGSGEMFKVDGNGNKIQKCVWSKENGEWDYRIRDEWTNSTAWRTNPEMFLKIEKGLASVFFPGNSDFPLPEEADIWKVTAGDGSVYVFGSGKVSEGHYYAYNYHPWMDPSEIIHCDRTITSWRLYFSKNIFNQKIKNTYAPSAAKSIPHCGSYASAVNLSKIEYGENKVEFLYDKVRQDKDIIKEYEGTYYGENDQTLITKRVLSAVKVYAGSNLARTYHFDYFDGWTAAEATGDLGCTGAEKIGAGQWGSGKFQYKGYYTLNDNLKSYHLILKKIREEVSLGVFLPETNFEYQNIGYDAKFFRECLYPETKTVSSQNNNENLNSIYLKKAKNGFGGETEYIFDQKRISDNVFRPDGILKTDNEYQNFNCINYCADSSGRCKASSCASGQFKREYVKGGVFGTSTGLKRARLRKIIVQDGIGGRTESLLDYGGEVPKTVYSLVLNENNNSSKPIHDSDFAGYKSVTAYAGKKDNPASINPSNSNTWVSKTKNTYHDLLTSANCAKKDPRSGSPFLTQRFDENGVVAESWQYLRFKNGPDENGAGSDVYDAWPDANGESCTAVPDFSLVLPLQSKQITAKNGQSASLAASCKANPAGSFCQKITSEKKYYQWKFSDNNNSSAGRFAANRKNESFIGSKKTASSQTEYLSKTDGGYYMLNKPIEAWINDPDKTNSPKYNWQKMFYDNLNGALSTNKNLVTKTLSLRADGSEAGKQEIALAYDASGNIIESQSGYDRFGNTVWAIDAMNKSKTETAFDASFHAYPISVKVSAIDNSVPSQITTTTYDYKLGVPLTVTDANNITTRSEYDSLGRLIKIFKSGDTLPSAEFVYYFNEAGTYGVPLAVRAKIRTKKNNNADILETFDLYNGLGDKIQSQSFVSGKVITSYADIDAGSYGKNGVKSFATDTFVSPDPFGKLSKGSSSVQKSYQEANLSGTHSFTTDIVGNTAHNFANPETLKSVAFNPDLTFSISSSDPINLIQTVSVCKTKANSVDENVACSSAITSKTISNFLGNTLKTFQVAGGQEILLTENEYDSLGRITYSKDADLGRSWILERDLNGNVLKTKNEKNTEFKTEFDALNRVKKKLVSNVIRAEYFYDAGIDGKNCGLSPLGKLCAKQEYGNNPSQPTQTTLIKKYYQYDIFGRLTEERLQYGAASGVLRDKFGQDEFVTSFAYDHADRVISTSYPTISGIPAETVSQTYDGPYLRHVSGSGNKIYISSMEYDDFGKLTLRKLGNGFDEQYSYNNATDKRLNNMTLAKGSSKAVDLTYSYNLQTGNIVKITDGVANSPIPRTVEYEYDNLSRLIKAGPSASSWDSFYTYDDQNSLMQKTENGQTIDFTPNYNLAAPAYHGLAKIKIGGVEQSVSHDALGRMTNYTVPGKYKIEIDSAVGFDSNSGKPQRIAYTNLVVSPTPTAFPTLAPTSTPTPPPSVIVIPNDGSGQSCQTKCSEISRTCASIGMNSAANDGTAMMYFTQGGCKTSYGLTCSSPMAKMIFNCGGSRMANWTNCRCALSVPTVSPSPTPVINCGANQTYRVISPCAVESNRRNYNLSNLTNPTGNYIVKASFNGRKKTTSDGWFLYYKGAACSSANSSTGIGLHPASTNFEYLEAGNIRTAAGQFVRIGAYSNVEFGMDSNLYLCLGAIPSQMPTETPTPTSILTLTPTPDPAAPNWYRVVPPTQNTGKTCSDICNSKGANWSCTASCPAGTFSNKALKGSGGNDSRCSYAIPQNFTWADCCCKYITPTLTPISTSTPAPTKALTSTPMPTLPPSAALNLKAGWNLNLNLPFSSSAKAILEEGVKNPKFNCAPAGKLYLTLVRDNVRKTFVDGYTSQDFSVSEKDSFAIFMENGNECLVQIMQKVLGTSPTATREIYFYDGEGDRIMKALADSSWNIIPNTEVLYINQLLEKDNAQNIVRKNYYADGKLVAVRIFDFNPSPTPTPTLALTATPTISP